MTKYTLLHTYRGVAAALATLGFLWALTCCVRGNGDEETQRRNNPMYEQRLKELQASYAALKKMGVEPSLDKRFYTQTFDVKEDDLTAEKLNAIKACTKHNSFYITGVGAAGKKLLEGDNNWYCYADDGTGKSHWISMGGEKDNAPIVIRTSDQGSLSVSGHVCFILDRKEQGKCYVFVERRGRKKMPLVPPGGHQDPTDGLGTGSLISTYEEHLNDFTAATAKREAEEELLNEEQRKKINFNDVKLKHTALATVDFGTTNRPGKKGIPNRGRYYITELKSPENTAIIDALLQGMSAPNAEGVMWKSRQDDDEIARIVLVPESVIKAEKRSVKVDNEDIDISPLTLYMLYKRLGMNGAASKLDYSSIVKGKDGVKMDGEPAT